MLLASTLLLASAAPQSADPIGDSYRAHLYAAHAALESGDGPAALGWLEGAPAERRGWEWSHLLGRADHSERTLDAGTRSTRALALAPDGARLALAGADGVVRILDLSAGNVVAELRGHEGMVHAVDWSPDGARVASAGADRTARIWDAATGEALTTFAEHTFPVAAVRFHPCEGWVASSSYDFGRPDADGKPGFRGGVIHCWDPSTGAKIRTLHAGVKPISSLVFDAPGALLAAGSWDFEAHVFDLREEAPEARVFGVGDQGAYRAVDCLALAPGASRLAAGSRDGAVTVWRLADGIEEAALRGGVLGVQALAWSRDGAALASGSRDGSIRLWDAAAGIESAALLGSRAGVRGLVWLPSGELASCGDDGRLRFWNPAAARPARRDFRASEPEAGAEATYAGWIGPDGETLWTCTYGGSVIAFDLASGGEKARWTAHAGDSANTLCLDRAGRVLLTCSWDGAAKLWQSDGTLLHEFRHEAGLYHCALAPDASLVAAAEGANALLWDVAASAGAPPRVLAMSRSIGAVAVSPDAARLAASDADGLLRCWNAADGALLWSVERAHAVGGFEGLRWSPDGALLCSGGADGAVRLWSAADGALVRELLPAGGMPVYRVDWSPDGARVAAAADRDAVLLDPVRGGGALLRLRPHRDTIWHLSFSASGRSLVTTCWDGTLAVHEAPR